MSHGSSDKVTEYYEGDQSKLYSGVMSHHHGESIQSTGSKGQVKRIWKVTAILSIVTVVEVGMGLISHRLNIPRGIINAFFLILTLLKAGYIVPRIHAPRR